MSLDETTALDIAIYLCNQVDATECRGALTRLYEEREDVRAEILARLSNAPSAQQTIALQTLADLVVIGVDPESAAMLIVFARGALRTADPLNDPVLAQSAILVLAALADTDGLLDYYRVMKEHPLAQHAAVALARFA